MVRFVILFRRFDFLTGLIAAKCGFHGHHANHQIMMKQLLKVLCANLFWIAKPKSPTSHITACCIMLTLPPLLALAIANDLGMLEQADFGVAFHGKPILREKVALQLNHTNLTGLLYLQGYKLGEFAFID